MCKEKRKEGRGNGIISKIGEGFRVRETETMDRDRDKERYTDRDKGKRERCKGQKRNKNTNKNTGPGLFPGSVHWHRVSRVTEFQGLRDLRSHKSNETCRAVRRSHGAVVWKGLPRDVWSIP